MPLVLSLKKLVGKANAIVCREPTALFDVTKIMEIEELFDPVGVSGSRKRIKAKVATKQKALAYARTQESLDYIGVNDKKANLEKAKKKTSDKEEELEALRGQVAAAEAGLALAKLSEAECRSELDRAEERSSESRNNHLQCWNELLYAENSLAILEGMVEARKSDESKAKLPLANAPFPLCKIAVSGLIPSYLVLHNSNLNTVKKALNFLYLNGVDQAQITVRSDSVNHLKMQLAKIIFPDVLPDREPSLSPAAKEKRLAQELMEDYNQEEETMEQERQAKRKSGGRSDFETPTKKRKTSKTLGEVQAASKRLLDAETYKMIFGDDGIAEGATTTNNIINKKDEDGKDEE